MKISDQSRLVLCHAHVKDGWTGQPSSATEVRLNSGFSRLRFSRRPHSEVVACVGFDHALDEDFLACSLSTNKIAVLWEPRQINKEATNFVNSKIRLLTHVLTHDEDFISRNSEKASFFYTGGSYIEEDETLFSWPKNRLISIAASKKKFLPGHILRHEVIKKLRMRRLTKLGSGYRSYKSSSAPYKNFKFSLVIENVQERRFFTEKLIHSLLYRCVPVYWGGLSLPSTIDERGIIRFDSIGELKGILRSLSGSRYMSLKSIIESNQAAALEFASSELNLQRAIGPLLGLEGMAVDRAADYFDSADALLSGRAKFRPHLRVPFS